MTEPLPFYGGWGGGGLFLLSVRDTEGPTTDPIPVLTELSVQTLDSHMFNPVISVVLRATKKPYRLLRKYRAGSRSSQGALSEGWMGREGCTELGIHTDEGLPQGLCLCRI